MGVSADPGAFVELTLDGPRREEAGGRHTFHFERDHDKILLMLRPSFTVLEADAWRTRAALVEKLHAARASRLGPDAVAPILSQIEAQEKLLLLFRLSPELGEQLKQTPVATVRELVAALVKLRSEVALRVDHHNPMPLDMFLSDAGAKLLRDIAGAAQVQDGSIRLPVCQPGGAVRLPPELGDWLLKRFVDRVAKVVETPR